jgi:hypothetical protein
MASATVYMEQGGGKQVVASGGEIEVQDGGSVALGASVTLSISGTNVLLTGLPTSDPSVAGALYLDSSVLTVSAG